MARHTLQTPPTQAVEQTEKTSPLSGLKNSPIYETLQLADFRWLWLGSFVSFMAMNMEMISRGWLVLRLENDSPFALTLAMVSMAAPMTVMSLVGGALADRLPKKYLIIFSQSVNAALTLLLAMLDASGFIWLGALLVMGVMNGSMMAINMPSRQAMISEIVPSSRIMNAVALSNSTMNITRALGPALAGILIAFIGTSGVFYLISAIYVISALSVIPIKNVTVNRDGPRKSFTGDIQEGLKYSFNDPTLRGLVIMAFIPSMFGFTLFALMPAWGREVLNVTSYDLGYLMAFMGIGALFGTVGLASMRKLSRRGVVLLVTSAAWGLSLMGMAMSVGFVMAIFFLLMVGLLSSLYMSLNMTLSQVYAAPEMRGRVMSIFMMTFGLMPIGSLPFGRLAELVGTPQALTLSGLILTVLTLVFAMTYSHFRKID